MTDWRDESQHWERDNTLLGLYPPPLQGPCTRDSFLKAAENCGELAKVWIGMPDQKPGWVYIQARKAASYALDAMGRVTPPTGEWAAFAAGIRLEAEDVWDGRVDAPERVAGAKLDELGEGLRLRSRLLLRGARSMACAARRGPMSSRIDLGPVPAWPQRCQRCGRLRDEAGGDWRDVMEQQPREVLATCATCAELLLRLAEQKRAREGRMLLRQRKRGYGPPKPGEDVFRAFREDK